MSVKGGQHVGQSQVVGLGDQLQFLVTLISQPIRSGLSLERAGNRVGPALRPVSVGE